MNPALMKVLSRIDPRMLERLKLVGGTGAGMAGGGALVGAGGSLGDEDESALEGAGMGAASGVGGMAGGLGGYALIKKLLSKGKL